MAALIINHLVADFDTWLPAFEAHEPARAAAGATTSIVWQSLDNPNNVTILIKGLSPEAIEGLTSSEDLKQAMQAAGVQGQPSFTVLGEGRKYPA